MTIATAIITGHRYLIGEKSYGGEERYTHYNNYVIFKSSFNHLNAGKDLYQAYPEEHWDHYKYSPTFAVLMAPFSLLPDLPGLFLWNLLNVMVLLVALWKLPFKSNEIKFFAFLFILIELITTLQNSQSNALIGGLIIFGFVCLERKRVALASFMIILAAFIKPFALVALALFLFHPGKLKAATYSALWFVGLFALPLLFVSPDQHKLLYQSWFELLANDHNSSYGLSVAGWINTWFYSGIYKTAVLITGLVIFVLPLINYKKYQDLNFRLLFLSSILIWVVIFNHKAESPTYVIAVSGIAIWFFTQKMSVGNFILLALVFVLTILSATDAIPRAFKTSVIHPYVLKAFPCILVWMKITYDLIFYREINETP